MRRTLAPLVALALITNACSLMPRYERPALPVPESVPEVAEAPPRPAAELLAWQDFLIDERLRSVIELALASNRDLRIAALNAEKVQALYRIQRADLYPGVGVMASGEIYELPAKMSESGHSETMEQYSVQLGVLSWELDLFGRVRSLETRALELYLASEQARLATHTSLVGGTAISYLALAADLETLELTQATLEAYEESLELIRQSRDAGVASDLDLAQAASQVNGARAAVARLRGQVALDRNALELVVGSPVPSELLPEGLHAVTVADDLAAGLSSEALLGRPDILMAEHQLIAANANIGAARAAFFPRISLTAGIGTMSPHLSDLFASGTGTWTFAPQILAPIFASGSLKANLEATEKDREIAVAQYEKAIQVAFREVRDALTLRHTLVEQRAAEEALVGDLEQTTRLSEARYQAGIDSYLAVLVAQRSLLAARQSLVAVRLAEQANLVTLYKALGGGGPAAEGSRATPDAAPESPRPNMSGID